MVGGYFCVASFAAHAPDGENFSKRITTVMAIVFRTRNCPRRTDDEIINFSLLSQFSNEGFLGCSPRSANKHP
jgi:ribosomal protein L14